MKRANRVGGCVSSGRARYSSVWIRLVAAAWIAPAAVWAQSSWPGYPNNSAISVTSGGMVGIGTASPDNPLVIALPAVGASAYLKLKSGTASTFSTYLGTTAVNQYDWMTNVRYNGSAFVRDDSTKTAWRVAQVVDSADSFALNHWDLGGNLTTPFVVAGTGFVGIGTASPQYLLSVNGTIGAKEFLVTNTGWSDYVFQAGYRLRPLSEVGAFIQANHHLPDIPSEAEVRERGISVGEMQAKLLAKVEELTLHMIAADERSSRLETEVRALKKENRALRSVVAGVEGR
jgi:hypothetical protein